MKKYAISKLTIVIMIFLVATGCVEKQIDLQPENVLQVQNAGLREGVFVRRYMLTDDYGKRQVYTPEILKNFIKEKLEPNYLFIANAYDLGLDKENNFQRKIKDFSVNLIASNHPIQFKSLEISKDSLQNFYKKKSILYNIDLVYGSSFSMADSMYKILFSGKKIASSNITDGLSFPQFFHFDRLTFGETLHPKLTKMLSVMKRGQVGKPVYIGPMWAIMRLNNKIENKKLTSFDKMLNEIIQQKQAILKFEAKSRLINELKEKYKVSVNKVYYADLISSFVTKNSHGQIAIKGIENSKLNNTFMKINRDEISLSEFISSFNASMQFMSLPSLTKEDLDVFVEYYIGQNLLYLDGLEKGADMDKLVKDKLINKEHRLLLTKYLNEEIGKKVDVTESEAIEHYNNNRDKWKAEYESVEKSVKYELKKILLNERNNELVDKLRKEYNILYNESLLKKIADQLTAEKQGKNKKESV